METDDFDLQACLTNASLSKSFEFGGLKDTAELKDTANGLFEGVEKCQVIHIEGKPEKFKAKLRVPLENKEDVAQLVKQYMKNTDETLKYAAVRWVNVTLILFNKKVCSDR